MGVKLPLSRTLKLKRYQYSEEL